MSKKPEYQSTLDLYHSLQPKQMNPFAPRKGYYFILEVNNQQIANYPNKIQVAKALWKLDETEEFNQDLIVEIQLESFKRNLFPGSLLLLENVVGKIIQVKSAFVGFKLSTEPREFICKWGIVNVEEKLVDENFQPNEFNIEDEVLEQNRLTDEAQLEIANAILDQEEYFEEWDSYEANLYLDIEEQQMEVEIKLVTEYIENHPFTSNS